MKNKLFFIATMLLFFSCGNAQKKKLSDKVTGVFSYSKNGEPVFKITDTIIKGQKEYRIYDYINKVTLNAGKAYYDKKDSVKVPEWKKKNLDEFNDWEDWLFYTIRAYDSDVNISSKKTNYPFSLLSFEKIKKGLVLEEKMPEDLKKQIRILKNFEVKVEGFDKKITTGFCVTIQKKTKDTELKILYKLSDI